MAWHLIRMGGKEYQSSIHKEWMLDSASDINTPPALSGAPGSIAYTPDVKNAYMKDAHETWVTIFEEEESD